MLLLPALQRVGDATVFADDTDPVTFYVVPDRPSVLRDAQGALSLALTLYRPDGATAPPPGAPADATLVVDIDLGLSADARAAAEAALRPVALARWSSRPRPGGVPPLPPLPPPQPVLVAPAWSRCAARLRVGGAGGERSVADPSATALAGARARLALSLGADDGALLEALLAAPSTGGLSAALDLAFYGRLPAAVVQVDADPGQVWDLLRGAADASGTAGCSEDDLDALSSRGVNAQALADGGALRVRVDPGASGLGTDAIAALRRYGLDRVTALVRQRFFVPFAGPDGATRFRLRPRAEVTGQPLSLTISAADVIEWPVSPQTSNLLQGLAAADLAPCLRKVTVGDPFWDTLALAVTAFADFDGAPVAYVAVDVEYDGGDPARTPFQASLVFVASGVTKSLPEPPPLIGGVRTYRYQTRIAYVGRAARVVTPWTTTDRFDLDVSVRDPARLDVTVVAGDVDFSLVRSVVAVVAFDDPGGAHVEHPLTLTAEAPSASLVQVLDGPLAAPARVTPTFHLADGTSMSGDPIDVTGNLVPVSLPASSTLRVSLLLSGDVSDVAQVLVELTYDDGNGYTTTVDRRLASLDDLQRWTVPLRDPSKKDFGYAVEIDYHHRAPEQRPAAVATGSQAIAIDLPAPPALDVVVHPELVDFGAVPLVTVDLAHDGATPARASLPFTGPATQTWRAPLAPGEAAGFTYAVTYHPASGDPVTLPAVASAAKAVVVPSYDPPAGGTLAIRILGSAIDFTAVQSVRVDVRLPGDASPAATATLTEAEPSATVRLALPAGAPPSFVHTTTFTPVSGPPVTLPDVTTAVPLLVPRLP